jgi:hypothetical protein
MESILRKDPKKLTKHKAAFCVLFNLLHLLRIFALVFSSYIFFFSTYEFIFSVFSFCTRLVYQPNHNNRQKELFRWTENRIQTGHLLLCLSKAEKDVMKPDAVLQQHT